MRKVNYEPMYWQLASTTKSDFVFKMLLKAMLAYARLRDTTITEFVKMLKPNDIVYDVGAFTGIYSIPAMKVNGVKSYAFEPNPNTYHVLEENIRVLKLQDRISPQKVGLSNKNEIRKFFISSASARSSLYQHNAKASGTSIVKEVLVNCKTLDWYVFTRGMPKPDIIKIDTEGNEVPVLEGARRTIEKYRPIILAEPHGNMDEIINWVIPCGYNLTIFHVDQWFYKNTALLFRRK